MSAVKAPPLATVAQLAERRVREAYWQALVGVARRGKVPGVELGHLALRVLMFLLGQRPGYFGHHKVIAEAVETNLTSLRAVLAELRDAGLLTWELVPPHHQLPTGKYTRTNVNRYFAQTDVLLRALGSDVAPTQRRTVAPTHPNSDASFGTDPKFEQHSPLPLDTHLSQSSDQGPHAEGAEFLKLPRPEHARAEPRGAPNGRAALGDASALPDLDDVLNRWRTLGLGEPDDRSKRALRNRYAEGATLGELQAAVYGAAHDDWLRRGRANAPFAVVFASIDSVSRFATSGRAHARASDAAARQRAIERRTQLDALRDVPQASCRAENAEHAAAALRKVLAGAAGSPGPSGALHQAGED